MWRQRVSLALLGMLVCCVIVRADDEDPVKEGKKISAWIKTLQTAKDFKDRYKAVLIISRYGEETKQAIPALVAAINTDKHERIRISAARAAARMAAKAIATAREDKDDVPKFDNLIKALTKVLRSDKVDKVREASALALGDLGPDGRGGASALSLALKDKNSDVVTAAAGALRRIGKEAGEATDDLTKLLANKTAPLLARTEAALALGLIKPEAGDVLPTFKTVVQEANPYLGKDGMPKADKEDEAKAHLDMRKAVATTIGKLGKDGADAAKTLGDLLADKTTPPALSLAIVAALGEFGPAGKPASKALIKAVSDPTLVKLMGDQGRYIRPLAMHALSRMGKELADDDRKAAVLSILKALEDSTLVIRVSAVETLGAMAEDGIAGESNNVIKKLDYILANEGNKNLIEAAKAARDKIRPPKKKEEKKEEKK